MIGVHSAKPFPVHEGELFGYKVEPGAIPQWLAEIVYNLAAKVWRSLRVAENPPSLEEIRRQGGFDPLSLLDLLAGGCGNGEAARLVRARRTVSIGAELSMSALGVREDVVGDRADAIILRSPSGLARPFPLKPARVADGSAVGAGNVPEWMARHAYDQMVKAAATLGVVEVPPSLSEIEHAGGFEALPLLDLLAGGDGRGLAFRAVVTRQPTGTQVPLDLILASTQRAT